MIIEKKVYIRLLLLLVLIIVGLLVISWLYNYGRVEINLPEGTKSITIQGEEKNESYTTEELVFSKTLPSNTYTITVRREGLSESSISVLKVGRFLKVSKDTPELKIELGRTFTGDNPQSCTEFIKEVLISFTCNGPLAGMVMHIPATNNTPSYTKSLQTTINQKLVEEVDPLDVGVIEGWINNTDELLVLSYKLESGIGFHSLYRIGITGNSLSIEFIKDLNNLPKDVVYKTMVRNGSLLLYNSAYNSFFRGITFDNLERINPIIDQKKNYSINHIDIREDTTLVGYAEELEKFNKIIDEKQKSIVSVSNSTYSEERSLRLNIERLQFCGNNICILDSLGMLRIYSMKFEELATFTNTLEYIEYGNNIFIATNTDILQISLDDFSGSIVMNFKDYKLKGLSSNNKGVVAALTSKDKSRALLLTTELGNYTERDVWPLLSGTPDYIDSVSVYSNKVFISPNLGEREYIPASRTYDYSQQTKDEIRAKIENYLNQIGLDRSIYAVKLTGL
jgi:hypothetical protein